MPEADNEVKNTTAAKEKARHETTPLLGRDRTGQKVQGNNISKDCQNEVGCGGWRDARADGGGHAQEQREARAQVRVDEAERGHDQRERRGQEQDPEDRETDRDVRTERLSHIVELQVEALDEEDADDTRGRHRSVLADLRIP